VGATDKRSKQHRKAVESVSIAGGGYLGRGFDNVETAGHEWLVIEKQLVLFAVRHASLAPCIHPLNHASIPTARVTPTFKDPSLPCCV